MTSNYLDTDETILCSYSHTVRNLFLSINAYHYPCSYKSVFCNHAGLSLLECDCENDNMSLSRRSRAKSRQKEREDVPCAAMKIMEGVNMQGKRGDQLHACPYYKTGLWPDQFLVYDVTQGRTNSLLSPWKVGKDWDTDDFDLLNRSSAKKKDIAEDHRPPRSSRQHSAPSCLKAMRNEKRMRMNSSQNCKVKTNPSKAESPKSFNTWLVPKEIQSAPTLELIVPFEHSLSWSQYAYKYREHKGLIQPQPEKHISKAKSATVMYPSKSDFQKTMKKISSIDLSFSDIETDFPLHKTERMCASDRTANRQKTNVEKVTLKGNMMHLHLPGNESPELPARRTSSEHKRLSLKGNSIRHELKPNFSRSRTPSATETSVKDQTDKNLASGLVTVCRSRPTIPSNLHGKLCVTSISTPAYAVSSPKSAGAKFQNLKGPDILKHTVKMPVDMPNPKIFAPYAIHKH